MKRDRYRPNMIADFERRRKADEAQKLRKDKDRAARLSRCT
jgi:hypothetical protein